MGWTRVRVRRERPTAVALAIALCVTMLVVYVLTLDLKGPDVVESMAAAPRVTREIDFEPLEGWCVVMATCDSPQQARLMASAWVGRGAAGYVAELEDGWAVVGAVYDGEKEAGRVAKRLNDDEGIPAETVRLSAEGVRLRITAPQAQIEAVAGADALLRDQTRQLGEAALQLDRSDMSADAARTLCALSAREAREAAQRLNEIPGAAENGLCSGLIERVNALAGALEAVSDGGASAGAALSGMLRCAQAECFIGQWRLQKGLKGKM